MRTILSLLVMALVAACASDPAHERCDRRLVPINAPAALDELPASKGSVSAAADPGAAGGATE